MDVPVPNVDSQELAKTKKILLISIFVVTVVLGVSAFIIAQKISNTSNNKNTPSPTGQSSQSIPTFINNPGSGTTTGVTSTTPTPTSKMGLLLCSPLTFSQNAVAVNEITAGSTAVTIVVSVTGSTGTLNYSSSAWTVSPSTPALTVSTGGDTATWTPPTSMTVSQVYTFKVTGITDISGNMLSSPCTGQLTVDVATPTSTSAPTAPTSVVTPTPTSVPTVIATATATPTDITPSTGKLPQTGVEIYTYISLLLAGIFLIGYVIISKRKKL